VRRVLLYLWYGIAGSVITLALLLSAARLALPMMDGYRQQVQDWLIARSGEDIRIGGLDLAWHGLGPEIRLLDVVWLDKQAQPLLKAGVVGLGLDLWDYFRRGVLTTNWIGLDELELGLRETEDGQWLVAGLAAQDSPLDPVALILAQPSVTLEQVDLNLLPRAERGLGELRFRDLNLRLRNRGDQHILKLDTRLPAELGKQLELAVDVSGQVADQSSWSGRVYVAGDQLELAGWQRLLPRQPGFHVSGQSDAELWLELAHGRPGQLRLETDFQALAATRPAGGETLYQADQVGFSARWKQLDQGWQLELQQRQLTPTDTPRLMVQQKTDAQPAAEHWSVQLSNFDLTPYRKLVPLLLPGQRQLLEAMTPSVEVYTAAIDLTRDNEGLRIEQLQSRFGHLRTAPSGQWPGLENIAGEVTMNGDSGSVKLDTQEGSLALPKLFRDPFTLNRLQGEVHWQRLDDRWRIQSPDLAVNLPDLHLQQRLRLDIPLDGGSPWLELRGRFDQGRVAAVSRFLPAGIMPEATVTWLDDSLIAGDISEGELLFTGRLADFPFEQGAGRMEIRARVRNGVLDYHPGWPEIHDIDAELAFINRSMTITSQQARIYATRLSDVTVKIPDLGHARLAISGDAAGDLGDMLRFVRTSPLADRGYPVAGLAGSGASSVHLDLGIRVSHTDPETTWVKGVASLNGDRLSLKDWDVALEDLRGSLRFTESTLVSKQMLGRLWGAPVKLVIQPGERQAETLIKVTGAVPLLEQLPADLGFTSYLSGRSNWEVALGLKAHRSGIDLTLTSDLQGIAVKLPQPLAKPPGERRAFHLSTRLGTGDDWKMTIGYGRHSAALDVAHPSGGRMRLHEAVILLNDGAARLTGAPGVSLGGRLETLKLSDWLHQQKDTAAPLPPLQHLDLKIARLEYLGREFTDVGLNAVRDDAGWNLSLTGPMVEGTVSIPSDRTVLPLALNFERLYLPPASNAAITDADPNTLPGLNLSAASLHYDQLDLGRVSLQTRPDGQGMKVEKLSLDADWIKLNASGTWHKRNGLETSRFHMNLTGGDLGKLLSTFGYAGNISGGETQGKLNANWKGGPGDFALEKLEGQLDIHIGKGRLDKVEPGAGRVFGLLNLQSLPRRLSLDFSDLFDKGFAFDRIDGSFTLIDQDAYTNNLTIEGPSARIEISGRIGLAAHDYDQIVTVVPQVSSGIPVAGALAGGPAVGAALLLADRLFGKEIEKLSRYQYSVTGSWESPHFTRLRQPDSPDASQPEPGSDKQGTTD